MSSSPRLPSNPRRGSSGVARSPPPSPGSRRPTPAAAHSDPASGARPRRRGPLGVVAAMNHRFSSRTRWATALVCAVLIAVAATWSVLYTFQPDGSQSTTRRSPRDPRPPPPAPLPRTRARHSTAPTAGLRPDQADRQRRPHPPRRSQHRLVGFPFRVHPSAGCAATGTQLDDATHQVASTTDGGHTDRLRFVGGYWQGAPSRRGGLHCSPTDRPGPPSRRPSRGRWRRRPTAPCGAR